MRARGAYLLEGVRIEQEIALRGLRVVPIEIEDGYFGRDAREVFNQALARGGLVTDIAPWSWGAQVGPRHRLAFVITDELEIDDVVTVSRIFDRAAAALIDVLGLTHGGAPRLVASVCEFQPRSDEPWRTLSVSVGGGAWSESMLAKLAPEGDVVETLDLREVWERGPDDERAKLWLSLHSGIALERRWDVRIFRVVSLLETVAREVVDRKALVFDTAGQALHGHNGRPATTEQARGAIYMLLRRGLSSLELRDDILKAHPSSSLWDEVGIWVDVRNAVAHEGLWPPPPLSTSNASGQKRAADAFQIAGRGDGLDAGWLRYTETCQAAAEAVIRAAIVGQLMDG